MFGKMCILIVLSLSFLKNMVTWFSWIPSSLLLTRDYLSAAAAAAALSGLSVFSTCRNGTLPPNLLQSVLDTCVSNLQTSSTCIESLLTSKVAHPIPPNQIATPMLHSTFLIPVIDTIIHLFVHLFIQ